MNIGDFITVVYYNPPTSEFPIFDVYYGQIVKIIDDGLVEYKIFSTIRTDIKRMVVKCDGSCKLASADCIFEINQPFGLNVIDRFIAKINSQI